MRPARSIRQDAASTMAGAIFMSNTTTREQCFQAGVFGLPLEYESFVRSVRKGMPLFLFDYNLRKLYGVFEAASDGGHNTNRDAFQRAYPAQVRISIIWKCRPLSEDEFSSAIELNYYQPWKFYLDLSYEQVVRLYELFDGKRVGHSIHSYQKNECLGTQDLSRRAPDKRSLTPNASQSDDQSRLSNPDISAIVNRYSSHTGRHPVLPPSVEVQSNTTMMPLETENFGTQIALMPNHDGQTEFPCQIEHLQATSVTIKPDQLAGSQSYPLDRNYPHKVLSSGRIVQDPTEEAKFLANQFYPSSNDFAHNNSISSGYVTQNPTYGDRNHVSKNSTPYPALSFENPQVNPEHQEHCEICIRQRNAHNEMYAYEHQLLSEGKALPAAEPSQQGIPAYPNVPEFRGKAISAVDQQKNGSAGYQSLSDFGINFENDMGVDMSDPRQRHAIGAERNTIVSQSSVFSRISPSQQPPSEEVTGPTLSQLVSAFSQKAKKWSDENGPVVDGVSYMIREQATDIPNSHCSVFSRISPSQQPPSQEVTGPTLSQLVSAFSQKAKKWSDENGPVVDGVSYMIREQATDIPYSHCKLNLPSKRKLEAEAGESTVSQAPFLNLKRRSEAQNADANLGKEINGKVKKRKLVRPSFEENSASTTSGTCKQETKHNQLKVGRKHFDIDLNTPATEDSDPQEKDKSIEVCPSVYQDTNREAV